LDTEIGLGTQLAGERRTRLQTALADAAFDLLLLTSAESVHYASGFRSVAASVFSDYMMAAVVSPTDLLLIVGAGDVAAALDSGIAAEELIAHGTFFFEGSQAGSGFTTHPDVADAIGAAFSRMAGPKSVLAVESSARAATMTSGLTSGFIDATEWLMAVRAVKLPAEQQLLRAAATIAEQGIAAGIGGIVPGCRERDIASLVAKTMAAHGAAPRFVVVTSGERSALSDAFASERAIEPGDLVRFDIGCVYDGYWSDIARTAVVGPPSPAQSSRYAALHAGVLAEFEQARPGVTAGELFDIGVETVRAHGLVPYRRHHVGHAIGLSVYERPIVAPNVATVLQPGMVFCLETPYYELGWGGMMVEDTGVVTDNGFELFTTLDRELAVVPR
jgi:Xaa-Pro aminopeptidase